MSKIRETEYYSDILIELTEIIAEVENITQRVEVISGKLEDHKCSSILQMYILPYLKGICGEQMAIMYSLDDVKSQVRELKEISMSKEAK